MKESALVKLLKRIHSKNYRKVLTLIYILPLYLLYYN